MLGVEVPPSSSHTQDFISGEGEVFNYELNTRTSKDGCKRNYFRTSLPKQIVQGYQERLLTNMTSTRLVRPEQIYCDPTFSNDITLTGSATSTKGHVPSIPGSTTCVLACTNRHPILKVSAICSRRFPYRFKVIPFDINIAPRVFTKIMIPLCKEQARMGVHVLKFLDDWLLLSISIWSVYR